MEENTDGNKKNGKPKVGKRVSSAIKAYEALQAEEAKHRRAFRLQKVALARAAAVEAVALRRAAGERRRMQEHRLCMLLGRLVFATLRQQGMTGTLLDAKDLDSWGENDRTELLSLIAEPRTSAGKSSSEAGPDDVNSGLPDGSGS